MTYGPFDRCLSFIVGGKTERNRYDRLDSSNTPISPASFLLFKGCYMPSSEIMKWKNTVGKKIILPSVSSFNQNFRESMYASRHKNENTDIKSVIFCLTIFNEIDYPGFRLNDERYTCYPDEEEVLLPAGCQLEVEGFEQMEMSEYTPKEGQENYNGKKFSIVYLSRFG